MRYVVAVAEERNFTRAAQRCFVVQSALSHQIAALERDLGVRLFARTSRRVEPTAAGEAFVARARECLAAAESAMREAAAANGTVSGRLAIGVIPTPTGLDIPELIRRTRETYPEVRVSLTVAGSRELTAQVVDGTLDVALLGLPAGDPPTGVAFHSLTNERLVLLLRHGHRLARRSRLRLADLSDLPFVDFPADTTGRLQTDRAFMAAGVTRSVDFEVTTAEWLAALVRSGIAVGFLAPAVAERFDVATRQPSDGPRRAEYVVWSRFNPSPATRAFLGLAQIDLSDSSIR